MTQNAISSKNNKSHYTCLWGLIKSLGFQPAQRDDKKILEAIENGQPFDNAYSLEEAGLLDAFFEFLETIGVFSLFEEVEIKAYERLILPISQLLLVYIIKLLIGIPSMNDLPELLFANQALMRMVGFNAHQLKEGICDRGTHARAEGKEPSTPICQQMLSNFVNRFSAEEIETLFNSIIRALARFGAFDKKIASILDASDLETTKKCKGRGCVTHIEKKVDKHNQLVEIEKTIYGFKVISIIDKKTQIPLAVKVVKIQNHESNYTLELLKIAQNNLKGYARITKFIMDRGFLDGQDIYQIRQMGILFYVPLKKNMRAYHEARQLALAGMGIEKTRKIETSKGKTKTVVIGVEDLDSLDSYCSPEEFRHKNSKDFAPEKINTIVVTVWKGKKYGLDKGKVFATNASVKDPFQPFDEYDDRSIIENLLYRESKQGWHLERPPRNDERTMVAHVFLTLMTYGLTMAYRDWQIEEETLQEDNDKKRYRSFEFGIRRYRRRWEKENRDHVIIFIGDYYGIFHVIELIVLLGGNIKEAPEGMRTIEEIYESRGFT